MRNIYQHVQDSLITKNHSILFTNKQIVSDQTLEVAISNQNKNVLLLEEETDCYRNGN